MQWSKVGSKDVLCNSSGVSMLVVFHKHSDKLSALRHAVQAVFTRVGGDLWEYLCILMEQSPNQSHKSSGR